MTPSEPHATVHRITVDAPAEQVFALVADVTAWPYVFPPTLHAEYLRRSDTEERLRIWATANGEVKTWTSRRLLHRDRRRIRFQQEVPAPPLASMSGEWIVEAAGPDRTEVTLTHEFRALTAEPETLAWITRAVDTNSDAELAALRNAAERTEDDRELLLTFADTVHVDAPPEPVYAFIHDADGWPERLPHVARVRLDEDPPGTQLLEMDTRAPDGDVHTTRSVRICFAPERIVYKQLERPRLLAVHTGRWSFRAVSGGTEVTSAHTVVLDRDAIPEVLPPDTTVARARQLVRNALGRNSRTTLEHAKAYVERRVPADRR
ncbi:aromatase/cyclase [Micromonospora sp. NPDC049559]|uniref:aromatase/cyclase n=1 Tax=Micromonospora sp. NPDC049559 TaxID=3155923 RepID=UPI00344206EA